ncbi:Rieske (2Fe-2S) protein [Streptomyces sp. TRM64462]|uniref:Rieske (2Fe-2S) protein n=1 Tax=Streptomyces sp. TRM64462 TaxID=2741726 RepID=UPI0015865E69|nr:Rieske (2Fe-2S) protein [Streptomyces sp. TRM64462]
MTAEAGAPAGAMTRRTAVAAAGGAGLAVVLTACGGSDSAGGTGSADTAPTAGAGSPATGGGSGGSADTGSGGTGGGGGQVLAKTSDIPEGGGKVFGDQGIVVTQPKAGEFKAFSAMCTHQGCAVKDISDGVINCPCHGSEFDAADGSVKKGPATTPLAPASITVDGDSIKLA